MDNLLELSNEDILIKTKKLQILSTNLKNLLNTLKEITGTIQKLKFLEIQYRTHSETLEKNIDLNENNELLSEYQIECVLKEAPFHSKRKLIQDYKQIEVKYSNLSEYYERVDRAYYYQLLEDISDSVF